MFMPIVLLRVYQENGQLGIQEIVSKKLPLLRKTQSITITRKKIYQRRISRVINKLLSQNNLQPLHLWINMKNLQKKYRYSSCNKMIISMKMIKISRIIKTGVLMDLKEEHRANRYKWSNYCKNEDMAYFPLILISILCLDI